MDNFIKFLSKNLSSFIFLTIGTMLPGMLTLAIFNRNLFLELDLLKLILLSCAVTCPTFCSIISVILSTLPNLLLELETKTAISYAAASNNFIFTVALIIKIFFRSMELTVFCVILAFALIIVMIIWFLSKRVIKESIEKEKRDLEMQKT